MTSIGAGAFYGCDSLSGDVYFRGNAPSVLSAGISSRSFNKESTLRYRDGTTGWTESSSYNSSTQRWCGYDLREWTGAVISIGTGTGWRVYAGAQEADLEYVLMGFYDSTGRMINVQMVSRTIAPDGSVISFNIPGAWDSNYGSWRIILLDNGYLPVSEAVNS